MAYYGTELFNESVSAVTATNSVALGTRRWENGKEYVYVYNTGTTANIGYGLIQSLNSSYSVTVSSAIGNRCFGVVQNNNLKTNYYGWAQVRGVANVAVVDSAVSNHTAATGEGLFLVANGGFGGITTGATGSTWSASEMGYTLTSIGTGQTGAAYITCKG